MALAVTAPASEPVSLPELKAHCRVDSTHEDDYLTALIKAARQDSEIVQHRAFITQACVLKLDRFPTCDYIDLPRPPLISVESITYTDSAGDVQTFSSSSYEEDTDGEPGRVYLAYGEAWPSNRGGRNSVTVNYTAGYGGAEAVPEIVKQVIMIKAAHWFENREPVVTGTIVSAVPETIKRLDDLNKFRGIINVYESWLTSP